MIRIKAKIYKSAFSAAGKVGHCDIEDTIVICGSPRSGTTLLLEALHKLPGYKAVNEPLLKKKIRKKHGFTPRSYIDSGQSVAQKRKFLEDVLQGQLDTSARWLFESSSIWTQIIEHGTRDKLVVKFCRINRLLPWFAEQFDVRGIIFLVRHPCAVVNSMMRFGQWNKWTENYIQRNKITAPALQLDDFPHEVQDIFTPVVERVSTKAEVLALIWCIDHYLPLKHATHHPWVLVPYERLVMRNYDELKRIIHTLGAEMNHEILNTLVKPSSSVKGKVRKSGSQISKWKQQLSTRQIDEVLSIVDAVNLSDIYSDSAEPNYDRLNTFQKAEWQW